MTSIIEIDIDRQALASGDVVVEVVWRDLSGLLHRPEKTVEDVKALK